MSEESVKVAVRVRPFNQREKDAKAVLVVQMAGNQTMLNKPKSNDEPKKFAFDYSYWSHDGFKTDASGYMSADSHNYCDQKKVYNDLGVGVLTNAWNGFNASLFAYGQTGSGKSYSVVGYGANKGIVPLACEEIFKKIDADKSSGTQYEVTFSMLEIYSEIVRDLLNSKADKRQGLQVREDPKNGFYAQDLRKQLVTSYADISKLTDEGTTNRTIAATNMNATSSRAHTIVTVGLVQKYKNSAGKEMAKSSVINLVDLAGSERADQTGATGDRLKEGAAINLSLTALGNVIAALADNSQGKNVRVPYRDSVLTKLLMNALGGNSKTIMIAAISPADINYDESLSTLRYADRAKQIKCKPVVNEDPTEKLIKSLQEENAKLKQLLASGGKIDPSLVSGTGGGSATSDDVKKALAENEKQMEAMKKSYEDKLAEAKSQMGDTEQSKILEKSKKLPHLSNINMDPSLSGKIKIIIEGEGLKKIGTKGNADIVLAGLGINDQHAILTLKGGKVTVEKVAQSKVLVNGRPLTTVVELQHMDRLLFGASQYFIFVDPAKKSAKDVEFTFEMAQDEIAKASGIVAADTSNMSREELKCQGELVDLIPAVDEANQMSIVLDKKVKFEAIVVSAECRGEYDGKLKPFVRVKNFATGLEWIWEKSKFLDRKEQMLQYYLDFKEDGKIDLEKFKAYDPFVESPDTPSQIGTTVIFPKSFAYLVANKGEFKITDLRGKQAGLINVEILPCDKDGKLLTDKDGIVIRNPEKDLLNKMIHFYVKINKITGLNEKFEDIYCQYTLFQDPNLQKTEVVRGTNNPEFKYNKRFDLQVTPQLLDNLMNKTFFIQIWGEQKHPKPNAYDTKISTKEYFDKDRQQHGDIAATNTIRDKIVDPEKQKLQDELKFAKIKEQQTATTLQNIQKLLDVAASTNKSSIPPPLLKIVYTSQNPQEVDSALKDYAKRAEVQPAPQHQQQQPKPQPQPQVQPQSQPQPTPRTPTNVVYVERGAHQESQERSAFCTVL